MDPLRQACCCVNEGNSSTRILIKIVCIQVRFIVRIKGIRINNSYGTEIVKCTKCVVQILKTFDFAYKTCLSNQHFFGGLNICCFRWYPIPHSFDLLYMKKNLQYYKLPPKDPLKTDSLGKFASLYLKMIPWNLYFK